MTKKLAIGLLLLGVFTLYILFSDRARLEDPATFSGGFKEVAFYKNENNTGPVARIYAVGVADPETADYMRYGNAMPHTLHGTTKVYFFKEEAAMPKVLAGQPPHFDTLMFHPLAVYQKSPNGGVSLKQAKD